MEQLTAPQISSLLASAEAIDTATLDAVLDSLLGADPPPHVLAFADTGLCVPVPPEIPVAAGLVITGVASGLELCIPADMDAVIEAWHRLRLRGGASVRVHVRHDPTRAVSMLFLDARPRYGVYLGVLVGARASFDPDGARPGLFRPRVCNMERDEVSVIRAVDAASTQILGWTADELVGTRAIDLVHPDDRAQAIANWTEMLSRPGLSQRVLLRNRHRDGKYIWVEITHRNLLADPAHRNVMSELVDVSERMEAVEALRAAEQLLRRITEALPIGFIQIDAARRVVYHNELAVGLLGTRGGTTLEAQLANVVGADRGALEVAVGALLARGEPADIELRFALPGGIRPVSFVLRALTDGSGQVTGAIMSVTDITERTRMREELERRAKYDTLTRCHNRASILDILADAIAARHRTNAGIAVVFVDLDRFKAVNDAFGHACGDELLRLTADRLIRSVRDGDVVGRLGGDEFLVVCPDVTTPAIALALGERIGKSLAQTATLGGTTVVPGSSIGVAWTNGVVACDELVAWADEAMYTSKRDASGPVLAAR